MTRSGAQYPRQPETSGDHPMARQNTPGSPGQGSAAAHCSRTERQASPRRPRASLRRSVTPAMAATKFDRSKLLGRHANHQTTQFESNFQKVVKLGRCHRALSGLPKPTELRQHTCWKAADLTVLVIRILKISHLRAGSPFHIARVAR